MSDERYDYHEAVKADVLEYIRENINMADYDDKDDLAEDLRERCWISDSVTGNASGSYYCNTWKAADALNHNWDLILEAKQEYGDDRDYIEQGEEFCDVTIRCYLLGEAIDAALDDLEDEWDAAHPEVDE